MAKTKGRRWVCSECGHGHLAPSRMPKMDPRRYCLTCSAGRTLFVERVCPALKKEKEKKAEKKRLQKRKKEEQEKQKRDQKWTLQRHNLWPEFQKLRRKVPDRGGNLRIRWSKTKTHSSGSLSYGYWVVTLGSEAADALVTLAWALTRGHRRRMMLIFEELYGFSISAGLPKYDFSRRARHHLLKIFPPPAPSSQGVDRERLQKMAELGDSEAQDALNRLNLRNNQ